MIVFFFFQAEDGIRDGRVTGVQTCALPISNPPQHYAARFAGKEAVGKALGSGVHFTWREIEIAGRPKPGVALSGRTKAWAERVGAGRIELSMTHSRELATAVCVVSDV